MLVSAKEMLEKAKAGHYAVGQFNINNLEWTKAILLTVLAAATPAAIPGLTVGCLLANLFGGSAALGIWDVCLGTLTTLVAAIASYALRRIKPGSLPVLSVLPPILLNAAVVGAELAWTLTPSAPGTFWLMAAQVAAGQTLACAALGLPLYAALDKSGVLSLLGRKI